MSAEAVGVVRGASACPGAARGPYSTDWRALPRRLALRWRLRAWAWWVCKREPGGFHPVAHLIAMGRFDVLDELCEALEREAGG